jgi:NADPH2:quinone reductase
MRVLVAAREGLQIEERPKPVVAADQILVEVASSSVNRADLLQAAGHYPAPPGWPPDVLGLEFAGTVVETGPGAVSAKAGDRVFGIVGGGGHATHLVTRADLCVPVPTDLDLVTAGAAPEVFITAHDALVARAAVRPGERVLIHGVGSGVGTAAVQVARLLGASTVGTSRTRAKLERAAELGLEDGVIASDVMAQEIGEVDVVIDLVGGDYIRTDVAVCRPAGRIVLVGLLAGASTQMDLGAVLRKRLAMVGTTLRARPEHLKTAATTAFAREVAPLLGRELEIVVDRVFGFDDAPAAYEYMATSGNFGNIVLSMKE